MADGTTGDWIHALLEWYGRHQRELPWRDEPSPYRVWVSEIMLQQTQVATVGPYFERFLARFPTVADLASAPVDDVLKFWEGLGYYRRARHLHRAAGQVVADCGGRVPRVPEQLRRLPGIGPYTAAAIASIAFGEPVPVVDGNVVRVFARFWTISADSRSSHLRQELRERLREPVCVSDDPSSFNQAIMELGALVCTPRAPACGRCPLRPWCRAFEQGRVDSLPVVHRRPRVPHYSVAVGLVWRAGRVLILRRPEEAMLGGLWEFPGGKKEPRESLRQTVVREVLEETGLAVSVTARVCVVKHAYSHFRITLHAYHCLEDVSEQDVICERPFRWIRPEQFGEVAFPKANHKIFAALDAGQPHGMSGS